MMRLLYALRLSYLAAEAVKERRMRGSRLVPAHYALLINVRNTPGTTASALARTLGVSAQNVASLASRLEAAGLLERRPHGRHAHVTELRLTGPGAAALAEADAAVAALERRLVETLGEERAQRLTEDLLAVQGIMRALMPEPPGPAPAGPERPPEDRGATDSV